MNKAILMGRLTRDPEVRYTQKGEPIAISRYTLAINRRFKRAGEPDADFIECVAFGRAGEFAEKYFRKGQMVSVVGRLQVRSWEDQNGQKRWSTDVVVEEQYFAESKGTSDINRTQFDAPKAQFNEDEDFEEEADVDEDVDFLEVSDIDDDLPF